MPQPQPPRREELWSSTVVHGYSSPLLKPVPSQDPIALIKQHGLTVPANCPPRIIEDLVRIVSLVWVDGQIVPREQFRIDPADEGLLFGRGVWESTRTVNGVPWLWPLHLERLRKTAALLEIDVAPGRLPDSKQVADFGNALAGCDLIVRLNVTAGQPAIGKPGIVWMSATIQPAPKESVRLQSAKGPVPNGEPFLVWKTFQYGGRMQAHKHAQQAGFDSALLFDADDNLLEMALANIFVRLSEGWATPSADEGGLLPGTVRQHLLEHSPLPIRAKKIHRSRLAEVQEAFITNSKVGIVPVAQIDEQVFPIGSETQELIRWLHSPAANR